MSGRVYFREEQQFRQPWLWAMLLGMLALFVVVGAAAPQGSHLLAVAATHGALTLWVYGIKLITEVRDDGLHYHFFLLWKRKTLPFEEVLDVEARTYRPLAEYGGWGIRRGARGWAYNVSGDRGVLLELRGGGQLLIGSQRPEELARAVRQAMGER